MSAYAVVALTFNSADVYHGDLPGTTPEHIKADTHQGRLSRRHSTRGSAGGRYQRADESYWRTLAEHLQDDRHILLLGHGRGHSNAMVQFVAWAAKHDHRLSERIVGAIEADVEHLTDGEILARAREFFGDQLPRWT